MVINTSLSLGNTRTIAVDSGHGRYLSRMYGDKHYRRDTLVWWIVVVSVADRTYLNNEQLKIINGS